MGIYDLTFYDLIQRNSRCFNRLPAWIEADDGRNVTFGQYREQVDRLAAGLQKNGIEKGDRIGVIAKNSLEYFILYGAAAAVGAIVLPINWRLSESEVCFNLNDCDPKILFVGSEHQELIDRCRDKLPGISAYYSMAESNGGFQDFHSLYGSGANFQPPDLFSDDGFVIIHTAAVAGRPRGALLSHANVLCANIHLNLCFSLTHKDAHLNLLPLFHVGGLFMATNAFHAGAVNINMSKFDAEQAVDLIEAKNVSVLFDFSPILSSIMETSEKTGKSIDSLQKVMGIDAPDAIEKYQKMTGGTFYCMYGQTETSCLAAMGAYDERPGSAGKVIPLAQVRLVDDHDREVPDGQPGEITMKGPMIFKEYWNLPEDTAYAFRNGWHHTGDLGKFDEDGFLFFAGRKPEKELIKPGGENVYPAEVERVILEHAAVQDVVVFGVPHPKWKEGIKAVCRLVEGHRIDAAELIDFVGQRIARYKKPQYVEFVDEFPLTDDGAIDREKVKKIYGGDQKA